MELIAESKESGRALLAQFEQCLGRCGPQLFAPDSPITVARAPGRIDCMGGIADYSGSVVFEGPLRQAAVVAFQARDDALLVAHSARLHAEGVPHLAQISLGDLHGDRGVKDYSDLRRILAGDADDAWAAYVLGVVPVLQAEGVMRFETGGSFLVWSDVPIGVGVSSSAALEVAAMLALSVHYGQDLPPVRLAELCQRVENRIVGAPCGIMDQVTSAAGQSGKLLAMRCQPTVSRPPEPCELLGQHALPDGVRVFGISSRVEHRVSGGAYARARVAAFMGLRIILSQKQKRGRIVSQADHYLCNLSPQEYLREYRHLLPERISGAEFLRTWCETTDPVTRVEPQATYPVRACTDHPVMENHRVETFIRCMDRAASGERTALVEAGGLMYASHCSYGWNCGLGCEETDLIVRLARRRGPEAGIYGAKITGGGSGGTVAILADAAAQDAVREIAGAYHDQTGLEPDLFGESGPGAYEFGTRTYRLRAEE